MYTQEDIFRALSSIQDPELKFSIIDLGLVYAATYNPEEKTAHITMTLTTPLCPLQSYFEEEVTKAAKSLPEVEHVNLVFTFEPRWSGEKATQHVQEHFLLMGIPLTRW